MPLPLQFYDDPLETVMFTTPEALKELHRTTGKTVHIRGVLWDIQSVPAKGGKLKVFLEASKQYKRLTGGRR